MARSRSRSRKGPVMAAVRELADHRGVHTDGQRLYTIHGGVPREFDPRHSKLAALVRKGLGPWPFAPSSRVLYLGAATGTTVRHVADLCPRGTAYAVERSLRSFRDLLARSGDWPSIVPILADAEHPESYRAIVGRVDVLYQDIADRDQARIFLKNLEAFGRPSSRGILVIKARSIDVARSPADVIDAVLRDVAGSADVLGHMTLEPYDLDHGVVLVRRRAG